MNPVSYSPGWHWEGHRATHFVAGASGPNFWGRPRPGFKWEVAVKPVCGVYVRQLVFSDGMPDVIRPGEKVFVVVDGVAYEVVNDDGSGSDIGSAGEQLLSTGVGDEQLSRSKRDETVPADTGTVSSSDNCVSIASSGGSPDKNGPDSSATSPKEPDLQLDDSEHMSLSDDGAVAKTSAAGSSDLAGISSVNVSQVSKVSGESTVPGPRTVLADDDEFTHLTAEFANSLTPDYQPSDTKTTMFAKSSPGVVGRLPLQRPQLPKITLQACPPLRLLKPSTANSVTGVVPLTVVSSSAPITSPPRQHTVTTVIRSISSEKVASQRPSVFTAESPAKKTTSVKKDVTAAAVKRSRQPRISKRIVSIFCPF